MPDHPNTPIRPLKVLVVEDNIINQRLAVGMLHDLGHTGVVVGDGEKALKCLAKLKFDVVLMDVMMPVMDGLEATKAIRMLEREDAKKIPIIAMTANAFEEDRKACLEAGMNEHIGKPIDIPQLKRAITKLLTKRGSKRKNIIIH